MRALAAETYGSISHLVVSPTDPSVVYINSEQGFWRSRPRTGRTGAITALSGAGGLPAGGVRDRIYLGPDGRTLIVGVAGHGIFAAATPAGAGRRSMPTPNFSSCTSTPGIPSG